ncbi:MAG: hypothetical protein ISN26_00290 [Betaproteobacteria bacterium AqS2]|uniref:Uncharacterized protein n=1 Tax=Candidatus Amphirhobacter heronislandensis TaxID=1732024 RepID=A0A930Y0P6_9GAMM|nr:hypothetical protein [Betaproteobacteria bacterium AqS2]
MDVDAAALRQGEGLFAELDAVGADDGEVGLGFGEGGFDLVILRQLAAGDARLLAGLLDRAGRRRQLAAARLRRRAGGPQDFEAGLAGEPQQRRDGEGRAAEIGYAQRAAQAVAAASPSRWARSAQALS